MKMFKAQANVRGTRRSGKGEDVQDGGTNAPGLTQRERTQDTIRKDEDDAAHSKRTGIDRQDQSHQWKSRRESKLDAPTRLQLSNTPVGQHRVVYVTGLESRLPMEEIIIKLRSAKFFGRYGKIANIRQHVGLPSHNRSHDSRANGVYITYYSREDAARAVAAMDGHPSPGGRDVMSVSLAAEAESSCVGSSSLREEYSKGECLDLREWGDEEGHGVGEEVTTSECAANTHSFGRGERRVRHQGSLSITLPSITGVDPIASRDSADTRTRLVRSLSGSSDAMATDVRRGQLTVSFASSSKRATPTHTTAFGRRMAEGSVSHTSWRFPHKANTQQRSQTLSSSVAATDGFTSTHVSQSTSLMSSVASPDSIPMKFLTPEVREKSNSTFSFFRRSTSASPRKPVTLHNLPRDNRLSVSSTSKKPSATSSSHLANKSTYPDANPESSKSILNEQLEVQKVGHEGPRNLTGQVRRRTMHPRGLGGFADVFIGDWQREPGVVVPVAIKVLRPISLDPRVVEKRRKRLRSELQIWHRLRHQHVLELYGTSSGFGKYDAMVSPWLAKGSISNYLKNRSPVADASLRLKLLCEVAEGLQYLHSISPPVIHGDLKGSNILIKDNGEACICDFGLSKVMEASEMTTANTTDLSGSIRWMALELFISDEKDNISRVSVKTDVYSFGCVAYEVLTGCIPFYNFKIDPQVIAGVMNGVRLCNPTEGMRATDKEWRCIQKCCADDPNARPSISEVLKEFRFLWEVSLSQATSKNL